LQQYDFGIFAHFAYLFSTPAYYGVCWSPRERDAKGKRHKRNKDVREEDWESKES
jgi:hypothetical protein